jgi:hypothetical protein
MEQQQTIQLEALAAPACERCGSPTRLVGLEPDPIRPQADLCTYECLSCDNVQARRVPKERAH